MIKLPISEKVVGFGLFFKRHKYITMTLLLFLGIVLTMPSANEEEQMTEQELFAAFPMVICFLGFFVLLGIYIGEKYYRLDDLNLIRKANKVKQHYIEKRKREEEILSSGIRSE